MQDEDSGKTKTIDAVRLRFLEQVVRHHIQDPLYIPPTV